MLLVISLIEDITSWVSISHYNGNNELVGKDTQIILDGKPIRDIRIPGAAGNIEAGAFEYCNSIVSVTIEEGIAEIGSFAFRECKNLVEVTLPASITKIGWGAFTSCDSLERINIADPDAWSKIEFVTGRSVVGKAVNPIPENAMLYYQGKKLSETAAETVIDRNDTVLAGHNEIVNVVIQEGVTAIAPHAFENCGNLKSITIPRTVGKIGEQAFNGCTGLEEVHLTDLTSWLYVSLDQGFYSIQSNPFYTGAKMYIGNQLVEDVMIPEDITIIGDQLRNYRHMTTLKFHNRVERIKDGAFAGCIGLKKVELPEGITKISRQLFYGCKNLVSVHIPDNYRSIEKEAFSSCTSLKNILLPSSLEMIGENAFKDSGLSEITIPERVNKIEGWAFSSCDHLKSVRIISKHIEYGYSVFAWNRALKNIQFPEGIEAIGRSMFDNCKMKSFIIPDTVRIIENEAFDNNRFAELYIPDSVNANVRKKR